MAVLKTDELLHRIKAVIGHDTSDTAIQLIEDVTDTVNDYDARTKDQTDWKEKYEKNDKEWREKYTNRFFSADDNGEQKPDPKPEPKIYKSFNDLFKEEK